MDEIWDEIGDCVSFYWCGRYDILGNYRLCILASDGEEAPRTENEGKLPLLPTIGVHGIFLNRTSKFVKGRAFNNRCLRPEAI
jgi:hypothetical protein